MFHHRCGTDHPRSRGEYYGPLGSVRQRNGSSPLSRGIRGLRGSDGRVPRIIPALAGNTLGRRGDSGRRTDHPRSRGEYASSIISGSRPCGSSPLSRGIPRSVLVALETSGIIPALAGNTMPRPGSSSPVPDHPRSRGEYLLRQGCCRLAVGSSPLSRGIQK